jgi:colanic acid biosynthesis protein WcaH
MEKGLISARLYKKFSKSMPIVCVDMVVKTDKGILLGVRNHQPAMGQPWLIGGRVYFGETLERAVMRKMQSETGLKAKLERLVGVYTTKFTKGQVRHTVNIVFVVRKIGGRLKPTPNEDYSKFVFVKKPLPKLHPFVRRVLNDSNVFKRKAYAAYKAQPFFVD